MSARRNFPIGQVVQLLTEPEHVSHARLQAKQEVPDRIRPFAQVRQLVAVRQVGHSTGHLVHKLGLAY